VATRLGGRVAYSPEEKVHFGAYFMMANYTNAKKILVRETWINPFAVPSTSRCHSRSGTATRWVNRSPETRSG